MLCPFLVNGKKLFQIYKNKACILKNSKYIIVVMKYLLAILAASMFCFPVYAGDETPLSVQVILESRQKTYSEGVRKLNLQTIQKLEVQKKKFMTAGNLDGANHAELAIKTLKAQNEKLSPKVKQQSIVGKKKTPRQLKAEYMKPFLGKWY